MRVSLAWHNFDDLDLHVREPDGNHIYYGNKSGKLDVDMNAGSGTTREPVENVRWIRTLSDGVYRVSVHQYHRRESTDVGFTVEVESSLGLEQFRFEKGLSSSVTQQVCEITVKQGRVQKIVPDKGMTGGAISQEKWGLKTLDLIKVNSVVVSPNHWDAEVGNKHWFFILDQCRNPLPTRGFYNEFLHSRLEKHRKVFEVLGDKIKCPPVQDQLSGVGFSSTRKDKVTVVAMGPNLNKPYTIAF